MAHDFSGAVVTSGSGETSDNVIPSAGNAPFRLLFHPDSWEWTAKHGWLPRLRRGYLVAGVNGHRSGPRGYTAWKAKMEYDGFTVIPLDVPVLARTESGELVEDEGYLTVYPAKNDRKHHEDRWTSLSLIGAGKTARVEPETDLEAYAATRALWVERGIVPQPDPAILDLHNRRQRRRAERRLSEAHDGAPHVQAHVEAELKRAAAQEADTEKVRAKQKAKRKRKPRAPRKKAAPKVAKTDADALAESSQ